MLGALGAGLIVVPWMMSRYSIEHVPGAPVKTCGDLTLRGLPEDGVRCVVGGRAAPGPGGTFPAPVSGTPCVWALYRVSERRSQPGSYTSLDRRVKEEASTAPYALEDATGRIQVDPAVTELDFLFSRGSVVSHAESQLPASMTLPHADRAEPGDGGLLARARGRITEEWSIPPGQRIWLEGVARQGPNGDVVLSRPPGGKLLLSVRSPESRTAAGAVLQVLRRRILLAGVAVLVVAAVVTAGGLLAPLILR